MCVCECGKACEIDREVEKDSVCVCVCVCVCVSVCLRVHGVIVCDPGIFFFHFFFRG